VFAFARAIAADRSRAGATTLIRLPETLAAASGVGRAFSFPMSARASRFPLTRSTRLGGGTAVARTTPPDTVKRVPFCARERMPAFWVCGTLTLETLVPTN